MRGPRVQPRLCLLSRQGDGALTRPRATTAPRPRHRYRRLAVAESTENARKAGVADRVVFRQGDALKAEIGDATVVTLYLLPNLVEKLKPRLLAHLKPGTRIVAHDFGFADWTPDRHVTISKNYYLYVVPARVAGKWRIQAACPAAGATTRSTSSRSFSG